MRYQKSKSAVIISIIIVIIIINFYKCKKQLLNGEKCIKFKIVVHTDDKHLYSSKGIKYLLDLFFLYFIFYVFFFRKRLMTQLYTFYIVEIKNCNAYIDLSDGFKSIG